MRCDKSQKLYNIAIVPLQICNSTDKCGKIFLFFYIIFLSPLPSFFLFSSLSLSDSLSSPSNPNPLLSNLSLSLCLPLPVSLDAVTLLDLGASVLTKTLTFAVVFSAFRDSILGLIALAFFFARGSSRSLSSSCSLSTRSGGPIGPRRRSCLG